MFNDLLSLISCANAITIEKLEYARHVTTKYICRKKNPTYIMPNVLVNICYSYSYVYSYIMSLFSCILTPEHLNIAARQLEYEFLCYTKNHLVC